MPSVTGLSELSGQRATVSLPSQPQPPASPRTRPPDTLRVHNHTLANGIFFKYGGPALYLH